MSLSKASILSAEDFQYALVACPEWGGDIRVRGLSAAEQSIIQKKANEKKTDDLAVTLCIMACVDDNGERIFEASDKDALKTKSYSVLERLSKKILELSGNGVDNIDDTVKN